MALLPGYGSYDSYSNDLQEFDHLVATRYRQGSRGALSDNAHDVACRYLPESVLYEFFEDEERLRRILRCLFPSLDNPRIFSGIIRCITEGEYRKVFAILLLIRRGRAILHFRTIPDLRDAKLPFDNPQNFPDQAWDHQFFNDFRKHQWMFCVEKFRYRDFVKLSVDQILPYQIEKELAPGASCKAFLIKADPEYNELHSSSGRDQPDVDPHTFVLKTYENEIPDGKEQYDQELNSFANILHAGNHQNIVSFFGSFKHGDTFHTILEYANENTLEDLMQNKDPPESPGDRHELWGALLRLLQGLMTLHNLNFPSEDGSSVSEGFICHYDIKPRNILVFVRRNNTPPLYEFKLADLGLSRLRLKVGANKQSLAAFGTRTYGAPELYHLCDDVNLPLLQAGPEVDIWSCGCVFSEVATWILGGRSGLGAFREMRSQAHQDMVPQSSDCFHDGYELLQCIAEHHASLREQTPSSDPLTKGVLGMVEKDMLVNKRKRSDASTLSGRANQMHYQCRTMSSSTSVATTSSFYPSISVTGTENRHSYNSSLPRVMQDGLGYNECGELVAAYIKPSDERDPQLEAIHHSPPYGPFSNHRPFYTSQYFTVPELNPLAHHPFGRQDYYTSRPPARLEHTNPVQHPVAFQQPNSSSRGILQGNAATGERPLAGSQFGYGTDFTQWGHMSRVANPARLSHARSGSSGDSSRRQHPSPRESLQPDSNPNTIQSPYTHTRTSSATHSELPNFPVDSVLLHRNNRSPIPLAYTHDLDDRDFVFLIDNSSSMRSHWPQILECVDILGYQVKRFDRDGIEICFTLNSVTRRHRNTSPLVDEVWRYRPSEFPKTKTNIDSRLGSILYQYRKLIEQRKNVKKKIIFVLTDGLWQPHSDENLENSIQGLISTLSQYQSPMDQIGIQFIQFGLDQGATWLLQKFDKLHSIGMVERDIIDCELYHAKGNVWKMLMGSINRWADDDDDDVNDRDELALNSNTISASVPHPTPQPS